MCGIVGAVAARNIVPLLVAGLKRLEYRGYDSAGLAVLDPALVRVRSVGRVAALAAAAEAAHVSAPTGIAHNALGHARRAGRAQRSSACERPCGDCAQRHHRKS